MQPRSKVNLVRPVGGLDVDCGELLAVEYVQSPVHGEVAGLVVC
jgi:hypothetical protein